MVISLQDTLSNLPLPATLKWPHGVWDIEVLKHGTMSLIAYKPTALKNHRFENFSDDFVVWAIFWGPKGGERN